MWPLNGAALPLARQRRCASCWRNSNFRKALILIWRAAIGKEPTHTYVGTQSTVTALAWLPDLNCLAVGDKSQLVGIWQVHNAKSLYHYTGHLLKRPILQKFKEAFSGASRGIQALAWSPNGRWIASSGEDHAVHVWEAGPPLVLTASPPADVMVPIPTVLPEPAESKKFYYAVGVALITLCFIVGGSIALGIGFSSPSLLFLFVALICFSLGLAAAFLSLIFSHQEVSEVLQSKGRLGKVDPLVDFGVPYGLLVLVSVLLGCALAGVLIHF